MEKEQGTIKTYCKHDDDSQALYLVSRLGTLFLCDNNGDSEVETICDADKLAHNIMKEWSGIVTVKANDEEEFEAFWDSYQSIFPQSRPQEFVKIEEGFETSGIRAKQILEFCINLKGWNEYHGDVKPVIFDGLDRCVSCGEEIDHKDDDLRCSLCIACVPNDNDSHKQEYSNEEEIPY